MFGKIQVSAHEFTLSGTDGLSQPRCRRMFILVGGHGTNGGEPPPSRPRRRHPAPPSGVLVLAAAHIAGPSSRRLMFGLRHHALPAARFGFLMFLPCPNLPQRGALCRRNHRRCQARTPGIERQPPGCRSRARRLSPFTRFRGESTTARAHSPTASLFSNGRLPVARTGGEGHVAVLVAGRRVRAGFDKRHGDRRITVLFLRIGVRPAAARDRRRACPLAAFSGSRRAMRESAPGRCPRTGAPCRSPRPHGHA